MRSTVLAALAASVLLAALPHAAADAALPAPQLRTEDDSVSLWAYWCPVLVLDGAPRDCGAAEALVVLAAGEVILRPVCIDRIVDDRACAVATPFVALTGEGPVVSHPLLP